MSTDLHPATATRHDQHGQWPQAESVDDFRHNLATVHARIAAACQRVGRDAASVRLLPVSKTKPEAVLRHLPVTAVLDALAAFGVEIPRA